MKRLPLRTYFYVLAGVGGLIQLGLICREVLTAEEEAVRKFWAQAEEIASREKREIVLIKPPERASGAVVFYLGRTVAERSEMNLSDAPELWVLRRRWPDKYDDADRHRMFRIPEEYEKLQKWIAE